MLCCPRTAAGSSGWFRTIGTVAMAVCMRTKTSHDEPLGAMDSPYPEVSAVVAADVGRDGEVVGRRCEDCPRARVYS